MLWKPRPSDATTFNNTKQSLICIIVSVLVSMAWCHKSSRRLQQGEKWLVITGQMYKIWNIWSDIFALKTVEFAVNFQGFFMPLDSRREESKMKLCSCIFDMGWGHGIPDFSYHVIMLPAQFNIKELSHKIHVRGMCPCTWTHKWLHPVI